MELAQPALAPQQCALGAGVTRRVRQGGSPGAAHLQQAGAAQPCRIVGGQPLQARRPVRGALFGAEGVCRLTLPLGLFAYALSLHV